MSQWVEDGVQYAPTEGVSAERSGERMVVLDPSGRVLSTLSPVGSLVWQRLPADFESVLDSLAEEFAGVERGRLAEDLRSFLAELGEADLIVATDAQD